MINMTSENKKIAMKVTSRSIAINVLLAAFKLFAGITAHSAAMIADAIHSISDLATTVVVRVGIKLSSKESDAEHQYGHERMEFIAVLIVAIALCVTGIWIGVEGIGNIIELTAGEEFITPGRLALIAAIAGIVVKEGVFWYVRFAAKKIKSDALMADAWHSRVDGLSSVGSLLGVAAARAGFPVADSLASIVICVFIIKVAISIGKEAINKITDKSCNTETIEKIRSIIFSHEEVKQITRLMTRMSGNRIYVDADISLDGNLSFIKAHEITDNIHDELEKTLTDIKHCMIHTEPFKECV